MLNPWIIATRDATIAVGRVLSARANNITCPFQLDVQLKHHLENRRSKQYDKSHKALDSQKARLVREHVSQGYGH